MKHPVTVVIPAYKKTGELVRNLNRNLPYLKGVEVIVVNDFPSCSIAPEISAFPGVKLIEHTKNTGFSGAVNTGIRAAKGRFVMLLNSDVRLLSDSWHHALDHFTGNNRLFAVSFAQRERDGRIVGKNRLYWHQGFMQHMPAKDLDFGPTAWAEGGASIFDREKVTTIGLFSELYSPFYWEDIDLSYRARKCGYELLFDPGILVDHHHESTIGAFFSAGTVRKIAFRNQILFVWANITDPVLLLDHLLWLPVWKIRSLFSGNVAFLAGLLAATLQLPAALTSRKTRSGKLVPDDRILNITQSL
ncbi:MAG: glycosyltransferase [Patescibacteria group bacterium]|nr:glycosyltransferase [Patescibacteria group bacterium]